MTTLSLYFLFLSAMVVRQDTPLKSGCETGDPAVATALAGSRVEVKFSLTGSAGTCYKVSVNAAGTMLSGYLPAGAISGIEDYDKARQEAPFIISSSSPEAKGAGGLKLDFRGGNGHPLTQASALLEKNQPGAALELIEKSMRVTGRDYPHLVAAGIAAYKSDDLRRGLEYLKEAQAIHPDRSVELLIAKLEKEIAGDRSGQKLYSNRFVLRHEAAIDSEVARAMVAVLEEEFSRVSAHLGCRTDERISTIIQSPEAFRASTDAAEWSAGMYDGKIRVPYAQTKAITPQLRQTFAHEIVHACLANLGDYPSWLHEGLAQKLSGKALETSVRSQFRSMAKAGRMPKLENLSQSWARMSAQHAAVAYAYSLAAIDILMEQYQAYGIHNVLRNPDRLPQITADLDRRLAE